MENVYEHSNRSKSIRNLLILLGSFALFFIVYNRFLQNNTEPFSNQNGTLHQTIQNLKNDNQLLVTKLNLFKNKPMIHDVLNNLEKKLNLQRIGLLVNENTFDTKENDTQLQEINQKIQNIHETRNYLNNVVSKNTKW